MAREAIALRRRARSGYGARVHRVAAFLSAEYGLSAVAVAPVARGHSNESCLVDAAEGPFVLRVAREVSSPRAGSVEDLWLAGLAERPWVPRRVPTLGGALATRFEGRVAQLFQRLPGAPAAGPPTAGQACAGLAALAELHRASRAFAAAPRDPAGWLRTRRAGVFDDRAARWPADVATALPRVARRIDAVIARLAAGGAAGWLHGDFHPGNVLFAGDAVTGVVDFDDSGEGATAIDLAVGLFTFSRDVSDDRSLRFDVDRWRAAAAAYAARAEGPCWRDPDPFARELFCAHQTLVHLEAARRGLWSLGPGIGFYPCFNALADG
jgi:Ser/Thr protein kinase RdoA (MazF antagonist)